MVNKVGPHYRILVDSWIAYYKAITSQDGHLDLRLVTGEGRSSSIAAHAGIAAQNRVLETYGIKANLVDRLEWNLAKREALRLVING
jgi:hypothetical protein